jgi:hypothetical protein
MAALTPASLFLPRFRRGERLTAEAFNRLADAIEALHRALRAGQGPGDNADPAALLTWASLIPAVIVERQPTDLRVELGGCVDCTYTVEPVYRGMQARLTNVRPAFGRPVAVDGVNRFIPAEVGAVALIVRTNAPASAPGGTPDGSKRSAVLINELLSPQPCPENSGTP